MYRGQMLTQNQVETSEGPDQKVQTRVQEMFVARFKRSERLPEGRIPPGFTD